MPPKDVEAGEHKTSIAVWDLVSPLVIGRTAKVKVGAKCAAGCQLTDHGVEIHDASGKTIARAVLAGTPWPGTSGLYWTDVEFPAPAEAGTHTFSLTSEHGGAHSEFSFIAVKPPDHSVTIQVHDKTTKETIADVEVRLGVYRSITDARRTATLSRFGNSDTNSFPPRSMSPVRPRSRWKSPWNPSPRSPTGCRPHSAVRSTQCKFPTDRK